MQLPVPFSVSTRSDIITVRLRTTKTTGMVAVLRSNAKPSRDFIFLRLDGGFLEARANLGAGPGASPLLKQDRVVVSDNRWHVATVRRIDTQLQLEVDGETTSVQIHDTFDILNIALEFDPVIVAGNAIQKRRDDSTAFDGILHGLRVNGRPVLHDGNFGTVNSEKE